MYDEIVSRIQNLGYVPSLRTMTKILAQDGITLSASAIRYWYLILAEEGIISDTGESPKWVLLHCPICGEQISESFHEQGKVDIY